VQSHMTQGGLCMTGGIVFTRESRAELDGLRVRCHTGVRRVHRGVMTTLAF
jgi:hypothetical protein